jgi:hypothetical protein
VVIFMLVFFTPTEYALDSHGLRSSVNLCCLFIYCYFCGLFDYAASNSYCAVSNCRMLTDSGSLSKERAVAYLEVRTWVRLF